MDSKQIAKRIALTIAWFLLVLFAVTALMGCATNRPMYDNLLFEKENESLAYKSITIEDIIIKEYCG
jgi:hypothetical protein